MNFTDTVRTILREAGEPLTNAEIASCIRAGYPEHYGTEPQRIHYRTVDAGLSAQIASTAIAARDIHRDRSVRPMLISLIEAPDLPNAPRIDTNGDNQTASTAADDECAAEVADPAPPRECDRFVLEWTRCETYEAAKDHSEIIYLHEWHGEPFYWGIARTYFGGARRDLDGRKVSGRYNSGYRHWIEGSLQNGARLYVAHIVEGDGSRLQEVENYLICFYGHVANRRELTVLRELDLTHRGDVPASLRHGCSKCRPKAA